MDIHEGSVSWAEITIRKPSPAAAGLKQGAQADSPDILAQLVFICQNQAQTGYSYQIDLVPGSVPEGSKNMACADIPRALQALEKALEARISRKTAPPGPGT
ncbi:MAG: hypothetical protein M3O22_08590 [Pseudomonadota bacterium]|nr:hypothetical protein [Pseudomonadota bacterium]